MDDQGHKVRVSGVDRYDHMQLLWVQTLVRRWRQGNQLKSAEPVRLILRYFMPQEMETLLHYNGFTILSRYGDWKGGPLSQQSHQQIYLCKLSS